MLTNKIRLPYISNPSDATKIGVLNCLAFADDIEVGVDYSGTADTAVVTVCTRFLPENVTISTDEAGQGSSLFYLSVNRQDKKTIPLVPLSTAVFGQGLVINETTYGSSTETFFLNSYRVKVATDYYRVGVSNFTQTQDNNPFTALTASDVLYFEV